MSADARDFFKNIHEDAQVDPWNKCAECGYDLTGKQVVVVISPSDNKIVFCMFQCLVDYASEFRLSERDDVGYRDIGYARVRDEEE